MMTAAEGSQLYRLQFGMVPPGEPNVWMEREKRESRLARIFYPCIRLEQFLGGREYLHALGDKAR